MSYHSISQFIIMYVLIQPASQSKDFDDYAACGEKFCNDPQVRWFLRQWQSSQEREDLSKCWLGMGSTVAAVRDRTLYLSLTTQTTSASCCYWLHAFVYCYYYLKRPLEM